MYSMKLYTLQVEGIPQNHITLYIIRQRMVNEYVCNHPTACITLHKATHQVEAIASTIHILALHTWRCANHPATAAAKPRHQVTM